jgi:hypothetical protein
MIYGATVQDFKGQSGGWFLFDKEGVIIIPSGKPDEKTLERYARLKGAKNGMRHATTVRPGELDIHFWLSQKTNWTQLAKYELSDGKLRIIWGGNPGERPSSFDDAIKDRRTTYYALKKVE